MRFLLRHPLTFVLLGLVVLFGVFFVLVPLVVHLVIAAAILWAAFSLLRAHRRHRAVRTR